MPPGANPVIDEEIETWLKETILNSTPIEFGYDTNLWTCAILTDLLWKKFNIDIRESTVRLHLKAMNFSFQKPEYQDIKRDDKEVDNFLNKKFPLIQ